MFDDLSAMIRKKKKQQGQANLRPDMDYAGQDAVDPNEAWDDKMAAEVNETLGDPDHDPASDAEMGENESSQDTHELKKSVARIRRYFDEMGF
jgi:hypothetical protein